jgi:PAS domain S-box-containing protein
MLIDSVRDYAIFMLDAQGHVATWNPAAEHVNGYRSDEIIGKHFSVFYTAEDQASGKPSRELETAATGGRVEDESWHVRGDGTRFLASVAITPIRDARAALIGFAKVTRDITERHQAAEQLRLTIEAVPTGIVVADRIGHIVLVNAEVEKLFGYRRDELIGRPIEMLIPERFRGRHPAYRAGFVRDPKARPMGAGRELYGLRKDGTEVPIEIGLSPLQTPDGDFILSSVIDITERKRSMEQFRVALEAAPTGMLMADRDGKIVLVNLQVERLFQHRREDLIGQPVEMLVPERFRARHPLFMAAFSREANARPMGAGRALYALRKDGTEIPIELGLNPIRTADGDFVLCSIADITDRQRAEREKADLLVDLEERVRVRTSELTTALKEREVLLQEIHHRVKNNLQIISSLINLQFAKPEHAASRNVLDDFRSRVQAIALIHEMLYQSRDYSRVPFSDYVRGLANIVLHATGAATDTLALEFALENLTLAVDKAIPCGLVLNELITNSLKHGFRGRRPGTIRVELARLDGGRVCLAVTDDGIGLPDAMDVRSAKSLGLQLVCSLARQLEGTLEVRRGSGASFRLTFPVAV